MFSFISWSDFLFYLAIALVLYYGIVIFFFYRTEVAEFIKSRKALQGTSALRGKATPASVTSPFTKFQEELKEYFEGCARLKPHPEEYILGLQLLVQRNPFVPNDKEKILIQQYITESSTRICSITLDPGEVNRIWTR